MSSARTIPTRSGPRSLESQGVAPGRRGQPHDTQGMDAAAEPRDRGLGGIPEPLTSGMQEQR